VHKHPQGREDYFGEGSNLQGKVVSAPPGRECTPEAEQESVIGNWKDLAGGSLFRQFERAF